MKQILVYLLLLFVFIMTASPWINPKLVEYDLLLVPRNILKRKSPLVRSLSDLRVNYVKGEAVVLRDDETNFLKVNDTVKTGDTIYVREGGWLVLEFGFGSRIKVNANTMIKVNELKKSIETFDRDKINTFTLEAGSLYIDYPNYSPKISMRVKTRKVAMAVRGTEFIAAMDSERQGLRVAVNRGLVEMDEEGSSSPLLVSDQMGASIDAKGTREEPKAHRWTQKIAWDVENIAFEKPDDYEQTLKLKAEELKQTHKKELNDVNQFKPQGAVVTNDNLDQKLKEAEKLVTEASAPVAQEQTNSNESKSLDQMSEEDLDELDLNFTRYNKTIPKINQSVLDQFAKKGLVPEKLKVAQETMKGVELYNNKKLKALDEIDDGVQ